MNIAVICPSRNRPKAARQILDTFERTKRGKSELWFALDESDKSSREYPAGVLRVPSDSPVSAMNLAAGKIRADVYAYVGDDNRFITDGWDTQIAQALERPGIAYPNDLMDPGALPSVAFISAPIVRALGYMAPPDLRYLYFDNFWADLGHAIGRLTYLDDVVIQHLSLPQEGIPWQEERSRYQTYLRSRFRDDVERVKAAL